MGVRDPFSMGAAASVGRGLDGKECKGVEMWMHEGGEREEGKEGGKENGSIQVTKFNRSRVREKALLVWAAFLQI